MYEPTNCDRRARRLATRVMDWIAFVDIAILILAAIAFARGALPL